MRGTIALPARWPGWSAANTLVLPIDPRDWSPPGAPIELDGVAFAPKRELHVTVIGKALGAEVRENIDADALHRVWESQPWRLRRSSWRIRLRKPDADVESIIEPVALPAMARLHAWLGAALGRSLPVPPPHVTLYVRGDAAGIGVPDTATLASLRVGTPWRS